jgi:hypothetical protein
MNRDALANLDVGDVTLATFWTDDGDLVPRGRERARLRPHPPIRRHGKVLDD